MQASSDWFKASDGAELYVRTWKPPEGLAPSAVLQLHHGMAEHGERYERFAAEAVREGFIVIAHDVRAHGKTGERATPPGVGCVEWGSMGALRLVEDMKELIKASRSTYAGLPLVVLGHSLGSVVSQLATGNGSGVLVDGVVLSGPPSRMKSIELVGLNAIIAILTSMQGANAFSSIPDKLTFQKFQANLLKKAQIKGTTGFEWLSRDAEECKKYQEDPFCGHLMSNGWFKGLVPLMRVLNTQAAVPPASVPVMVIQGESDSCGINDFGTYSYTEIKSLFSSEPRRIPPKVVLYGNARHELLNETNRDEVTRDALEFLKLCTRVAPRSKL
jgi:alpha-beta hydrolase superfamily lysophospholipase